MSLTSEQKQPVAQWVASGDNLSAVQKKLSEQFGISMTYMDVRFLVDDLNLSLKDPVPSPSPNDVTKAPEPAPTEPAPAEDELPTEAADADAALPAVTIAVDKVTLIPGALASGSVSFPGGVTGKWIVDNQGRPGLTDVSQPGYRPTPEVAQAFMQELSAALQSRGF